MRTALKQVAEPLLCHSGFTRLARRWRRQDTIVLAYHNIVPDGEVTGGDSSLHLPQRDFAKQLDLLGRTHEVVPIDTLFEARPGNRGRPRAVITFDDAYQGAVTVGIDELASRGMPATVFVAPAFVGGQSFWWDSLGSAPGQGLPDEVRRFALDELAGRDIHIRNWAERTGAGSHSVPEHERCATLAQLRTLDKTAGITLGAHTWSHPNLSRLEEVEVLHELSSPLEWLHEHFKQVVPWLSYPYGLVSERVLEAASEVGYEGAFLVTGGWLPRRRKGATLNPFALPRLNIPSGLSLAGFELRLSLRLGFHGQG